MRVERGGTPLSDFIEVREDGQSVLPVRHETQRAPIYPCQRQTTECGLWPVKFRQLNASLVRQNVRPTNTAGQHCDCRPAHGHTLLHE
jgi:hypothetical protein